MSLISRVSVRVPATTSNLGPGFDCLGLALGLHNELTLELHSGAGEPTIEISGEGRESLPRDASNLIIRAARLVLDKRVKGRLVFKAFNRIPMARGLGSSAAAVLSGLYAANFLPGNAPVPEEKLLELACGLEGHPDNVCAAIHGGLVVSLKGREGFRSYPLEFHKDLAGVVCIPEFELSTKKSRAVLSKKVDRADAVFNTARALLLVSVLEQGRWEFLDLAMEDRLHQPARAKLVRGFFEVMRAASQAGICGAALSGAGPTVLALCQRGPRADKIGLAMQKAFQKQRVESRYLVLEPDLHGVRIDK